MRPGEGTETKLVRNRQDRTFQVSIGTGEQPEVTAKRDFLDEQRWQTNADGLLVAIVRRPIPPRETKWSLVLGVQDPATDRVRVFFSEQEATRLLDELKRRVPTRGRGPLDPRPFAVSSLKSLR